VSFSTQSCGRGRSLEAIVTAGTGCTLLHLVQVCQIGVCSRRTRVLVWSPGAHRTVVTSPAGHGGLLLTSRPASTGDLLGARLTLLHMCEVGKVCEGSSRAGILHLVVGVVAPGAVVAWGAGGVRVGQTRLGTGHPSQAGATVRLITTTYIRVVCACGAWHSVGCALWAVVARGAGDAVGDVHRVLSFCVAACSAFDRLTRPRGAVGATGTLVLIVCGVVSAGWTVSASWTN